MMPGNIPLAFCTILVRKFIDSYAGTLPVAATSSAVPIPLTAAVLSGALIGLYHQLRKGTLVKIGVGRKISSFIRNSRHTIQRRVSVNSWFLRNAQACRRKCTEAMHRLARQSSESLEEIKHDTGVLPEINSMPEIRMASPMERDALARHVKEPLVMDLFNKQGMSENTIDLASKTQTEPKNTWRRSKRTTNRQNSQEIDIPSCVDLTCEEVKEPKNRWRDSKRPCDKHIQRAVSYGPVSHRPVTRHFFRRNLVVEDRGGDLRNRLTRTISKNRKKSLSLPRITKTTVEIPVVIRTEPDYYKDFSRQIRRSSNTNQSRTINNYRNQSGDQPDHKLTKRKMEPLKIIQKVTRKTRSGRIYAYRL